MGKINIKDIVEEAREYGWELISEKYQNLDEELVWECSEGHRVYAPYRKIRGKYICPVCEANKYKEISTKIVVKKPGVRRVLALDQSTHLTGYSIFDNEELVTYGIFETQYEDEIARDHEVKVWLISMIHNWEPDYIGIEGIQYQQQMGVTTFETLARLQGILMDLCYEMEYKYNICPTNTWRHFCGVKGRSRVDKKRSTQILIKEWYDISVNEDVADAIGIGRYMAKSVVAQPEVVEWE